MDVFSLLVACMLSGATPTTERCTTRVVTESETPEFSERFTLSLNDPVEFFRFQSRWRPEVVRDSGIFVLVPGLGDIRDRFIDDDPFNDTLFFTWMIGGAGFERTVGRATGFADVGLIHLKERYAGNFVHSDEEREPALNRLYDFSQLAGASTVGLRLDPSDRLRLAAWYARIDLKSRGKSFSEQESNLEARLLAWRGESSRLGFYVQRYERLNGLRRDGNQDALRLARFGLFGEF